MFRSILSKLIITVCIVTCIGLIVFLALPLIIDAFILPPLLEKTPFAAPHASISRFTPHELSGSVDLEHRGKPSVSIPRFKLRFTPKALLHQKIDSLELTNAVFHLYRDQGRWLFPGDTGQQSKQQDSPSSGLRFLLPLGVDTLILKQCRVIIHDNSGLELHIGVSAHIEPEFTDRENSRLLKSIHGSLLLYDDVAAAVSFEISANDDHIRADLDLENGNLFLPDSLLPDTLKPFTFNSLSARLHFDLAADTFGLKNYNLKGTLADMHFKAGQIDVGDSGKNRGVSFALSGTDREHTYEITSLSLNSPVQAEVNISGTATYEDNQLRTGGNIRSVLFSANEADTVKIPLSLQYDGRWSKESGYRFTASGDYSSNQPLTLFADLSITGLDNLQFSGTIEGYDDRTKAHVNLKSTPLTVTYNAQKIKTSAIDLAASVTGIDEDYTARLSGSLTSVDLPGYAVRLDNLQFNLPYATTPSLSEDFSEGSFAIESLLLNGEQLAGISASIIQKGTIYTGSGSIDALFNPDLHVTFSAEASLFTGAGRIEWNLAPTDIKPESLPDQISLPVDLDFSGMVAASGSVDVNNCTVSAGVKTSINNASLELSDSGLSMEDINCSVEFPALPRLSSSPSQYCSTGSIDLASLHFDDAELYFRVEDSQSIFIEKSRLSWCEGTLGSGSIRLSPDNPEIDTTLYCSRIKLGSLLKQVGFKGTEGEGSLNGTLPIRLSKSSLEFDDGFLFSTPGTGGIVRFTDTELLRQGMGTVSETGYISYSLAALEDFTYNWTKLTFDSSEDDLLLTLELDGKPTTPLPFKFDNKGMIVESSKGKGLQYPIRLDVNFRLPLAELFQIGQSMNSLMGNSQ